MSYNVCRDSSVQISISINQSHTSLSNKNIVYKTNAMMNCEISNVNYISTIFVREMKAVSMKEYFSRVITIDEKKLTSAAYNALYAIKFSVQRDIFSVHIFRVINMKTRVILRLL